MNLAKRLAEIRNTIESTCQKVGRDVRTVNLLAVSKTQPIELIEEAYASGLRHFGENYAQELVLKSEKLKHLKDIQWHLIGHLQSNKVKIALEHSQYFHALDSLKLAKIIHLRHCELGLKKPYPVFIEVNIDAEPSKSGVLVNDAGKALGDLIDAIRNDCVNTIDLKGLMCIPSPILSDKQKSFRSLSDLAQKYKLNSLSMGMSDDFPAAIEEGAHWIRLGRSLFGDRKK